MQHLFIFPTNFCPNECPHCMCRSCKQNRNTLKVEEIATTINRVNPDWIHITGGEPLFYKYIYTLCCICAIDFKVPTVLYTSTPSEKEIDLYAICNKLKNHKFGLRQSISDHLIKNDTTLLPRVIAFHQEYDWNKDSAPMVGVISYIESLTDKKWINELKENGIKNLIGTTIAHVKSPKTKSRSDWAALNSDGSFDYFKTLEDTHYKEASISKQSY